MDIEQQKQEIMKKWIYDTPLLSLPEVSLKAMDEYASLHPKIKKLADRNYNAQLKRGTITDETCADDFIEKIDEEVEELNVSIFRIQEKFEDGCDPKELADIILVCLSMAKHFKIDIFKVLEEKVVYNENRED